MTTSNHKALKKGFTLIELLVVISIIALLSSVVLSSLKDAQFKARGASITQSMLQVKNALELYKTEKGYYPDEYTNGSVAGGITNSSAMDSYLQSAAVIPKYIKAFPDLTVMGGGSFVTVLYFNPHDITAIVPSLTCGATSLDKAGYVIIMYSIDSNLNVSLPKLIDPNRPTWYVGYYCIAL